PGGVEPLVVQRARGVRLDRRQPVGAECEREQLLRERRIPRDDRPVQVRPDESSIDRAVGPVAVAHADRDTPEWREVLVAHRAPRVVLEAGEREVARVAVDDDLTDRARCRACYRVEAEQTKTLRTSPVGDREAAAEDL